MMENPVRDNAPWQFKWQRPQLVASSTYDKDPLLDGMVTIDSKTARLTTFEARTILDSLDSSSLPLDLQKKLNEGNDQHKHVDMKWEDLDESSDGGTERDDEEETPLHGEDKNGFDCDCILSVRILASRESVQFMEYLKQNDVKNIDQNVTADAVYIEVLRDSIHIKDNRDDLGRPGIESDKEDHTVLFRKLFHWPTSALTYVHNDVSLTQFQESLSVQWHSIIKPFIQNENYQDWQKKQKIQWDANQLKRRIGLASFCLCRKQLNNEIDSNTIDQDDINEIISRMSFGTFDKFNATNNPGGGRVLKSALDEHSTTPDADNEKELLLCCITNDGQVHMFSILDLLVHRVEKDSHDSSKNLFQHFNDKDGDEHFGFGFERFLFGSKIQAKLQEDLFPLSRPKVSISLSIFSEMIQNFDDKISNPNKEDQVKQNLINLSLLDANIDPTSIQHRTTNNIPTLCISSGDYVVIGGAGKKIDREQEDQCGGFITLISLLHLSETRTIFFPFVPINISPLLWNEMKLIMIMSETSNQCFAIRTDATTYVSLNHHQVHEQQSTPIMKFSIMEIVLDDYFFGTESNGHVVEMDQNEGLRPLSITTISDSPAVVCCSMDNSCVNVTLHQMTGLQVKQSRIDGSDIRDDTIQQNVLIESTLQRHYYVQIPLCDESMGTSEEYSVNVVSCLSGKVRFRLFQNRFQSL